MEDLLLTTYGLSVFATAANPPNVLQLDTLQAAMGIGVVLVAIGVAWGTLRNSVNNIVSSVNKLEKSMDKLRDSITDHKADITGLKAHTKYGISGSPMVPSEDGKILLEKSGFNTQYPLFKDAVFAILDRKQPRTLYDYEVDAYGSLEEIKDDPLIDPLKDYAVNHPNEPLELIFKIASWVIRDDYATYKGRPTEHGA